MASAGSASLVAELDFELSDFLFLLRLLPWRLTMTLFFPICRMLRRLFLAVAGGLLHRRFSSYIIPWRLFPWG